MIQNYFRGHKVIYNPNLGCWLYTDNNQPAPLYGKDDSRPGIIRPCARCGEVFGLDEPDPCLGKLPGVKAACCGHGVAEDSSIVFENGLTIDGFEVSSAAL